MIEKTLCQYLRELRKTFGYTQEYVASQLNIIHQTYSHYETGRIVPPTDALYRLSKLYHIPVENLLNLLVSDPGDTVLPPDTSFSENEFSKFLDFANAAENNKKYKNLTKHEKELLYYYNQLPLLNKDKILDMIKLECKYQKK